MSSDTTSCHYTTEPRNRMKAINSSAFYPLHTHSLLAAQLQNITKRIILLLLQQLVRNVLNQVYHAFYLHIIQFCFTFPQRVLHSQNTTTRLLPFCLFRWLVLSNPKAGSMSYIVARAEEEEKK